MSNKKVILVIGATGAQGLHAIDALLKPEADGTPSPYSVRALTRNKEGERAKTLAIKGVEVVEGSFLDFASVEVALQGAYGAFVNTDGGTVGDQKEIYAGMRIFETAKATGTLRHYIWSSTFYTLKLGGYDPKYNIEHSNAKARVADWMKAQESVVSDNNMSWTALTIPIYMDMIKLFQLGPMNIRPNGTRVFANPFSVGPVPLMALSDVGFWVRYCFDHRLNSSGHNFQLASDWVSYDTLPRIFTKVTGLPAVYKSLGVEEWFDYIGPGKDLPFASEGLNPRTFRDNFTCWFHWWRDSSRLLEIDMDWIRSIHPDSMTVEEFIRSSGWDGRIDTSVLKHVEDKTGKALPDLEKVATL